MTASAVLPAPKEITRPIVIAESTAYRVLPIPFSGATNKVRRCYQLRRCNRFGVSTAVIALRLGHLGLLSNEEVQQILHEQIVRFEGNGSDLGESRSRGENFYNLVSQRVSRRFARALIVSAKLGETSFTEAFRMLGIRKQSTFDGIAQQLGM